MFMQALSSLAAKSSAENLISAQSEYSNKYVKLDYEQPQFCLLSSSSRGKDIAKACSRKFFLAPVSAYRFVMSFPRLDELSGTIRTALGLVKQNRDKN